MSRSERRFAKYIAPDVNEARLNRQWLAVRDQLRHRRSKRSWGPWVACGAALSLGAASLVWSRLDNGASHGEALSGVVVETGTGDQEVITLSDGSRLVLEPSSRVRLAKIESLAVRLELERGEVDVDVAHVPKRSFVVAAPGAEVSVVGTKFHVALRNVEGKGRVSVAVERGKVKLNQPGVSSAPLLLAAGESWFRNVDYAPPIASEIASADPSASSGPAAKAPRLLRISTQPMASASTAESHVPAGFSELVRAGHHREAYALLEERGLTQIIGNANADELFDLAETARLTNHARDAATAFDVIRRWHRSDRRAGLAALELGRLRFDEFKDVVGAIEAFDDAVLLLGPGALKEDAEARRVEALEQAHWTARCRVERDNFLERHPGSPHGTLMAARCPERLGDRWAL